MPKLIREILSKRGEGGENSVGAALVELVLVVALLVGLFVIFNRYADSVREHEAFEKAAYSAKQIFSHELQNAFTLNAVASSTPGAPSRFENELTLAIETAQAGSSNNPPPRYYFFATLIPSPNNPADPNYLPNGCGNSVSDFTIAVDSRFARNEKKQPLSGAPDSLTGWGLGAKECVYRKVSVNNPPPGGGAPPVPAKLCAAMFLVSFSKLRPSECIVQLIKPNGQYTTAASDVIPGAAAIPSASSTPTAPPY
jgi:hypothetical protein